MKQVPLDEIARCFFLKNGKLYWRRRPDEHFASPARARYWNSRHAHQVVSLAVDPNGYFRLRLKGRYLCAHRVIWAVAFGKWPEGQIDHINGIRTDNRLENLRDVSPALNSRNTTMRPDNKSGVVGVHWAPSKNRWIAHVCVDGARTTKRFRSFNAAVAYRQELAAGKGFTARHGQPTITNALRFSLIGRAPEREEDGQHASSRSPFSMFDLLQHGEASAR